MDDKFEKILNHLREQNPSDLQVEKWKKSVQRELDGEQGVVRYIKKTPKVYWGQLVAAVFIGVVIGGLLFSHLKPENSGENMEIAYENATIETVYTNL